MKEEYAHPFIVPGDTGGTHNLVDGVLAFMIEAEAALAVWHDEVVPNETRHHCGAEYVLQGVRSAVAYMYEESLRIEQPGNVSQIPGPG